MIEKIGYDDYDMICDLCGVVLHLPWGNDFKSCINQAKEEGWSIRKDKTSGEWENLCQDCKS